MAVILCVYHSLEAILMMILMSSFSFSRGRVELSKVLKDLIAFVE